MLFFFRWCPYLLSALSADTRRTVRKPPLRTFLLTLNSSLRRHRRRSALAFPPRVFPSNKADARFLSAGVRSLAAWDLTSAVQQQLCTDTNDDTLTVLLVFSVFARLVTLALPDVERFVVCWTRDRANARCGIPNPNVWEIHSNTRD